ncbi:Dabb family protein [Salinibacterium sp. ZJ450]|uniref:Dabb family protein n=1 Tax=Salinibacterium sp. ZJ450 TaxID=2708338 RepID=UPI00142154AB|nr:Dabb family protein [Salinibacterium sp. ZJ450]
MAIRQLFLWSVKDGHDAERVLEQMSHLNRQIPRLIDWSIGKHIGVQENATIGKFDYGMTIDVESYDDLNSYLNDPDQVALVDEIYESLRDSAWVDLSIG